MEGGKEEKCLKLIDSDRHYCPLGVNLREYKYFRREKEELTPCTKYLHIPHVISDICQTNLGPVPNNRQVFRSTKSQANGLPRYISTIQPLSQDVQVP